MLALQEIQRFYDEGKINLAYRQLCAIKDFELKNSVEFKSIAGLILSDLSKHKQALVYIRQCVEFFNDAKLYDFALYFQLREAIALFALGYSDQAKSLFTEFADLQTNTSTNQLILFYSSIVNGDELTPQNFDFLTEQAKQTTNFACRDFFELRQLVHQVKLNSDAELPPLPSDALPFYRCVYFALRVLFQNDGKDEFLYSLGQLEGIVFYRDVILQTIQFLMTHKQLSEIEIEFLTRWQQSYLSHLESTAESRLMVCNYKTCESRCCYDGAYLEDGEEEMIRHLVQKHPTEFAHLPNDFIVDGCWNDLMGRKTNTRPHVYKSPDYPSHFAQTRCVFANDDGACSLQLLAMKENKNSWAYKPQACLFHPLQTTKNGFYAPPKSIEDDVYNIGLNYTGYATYTPCGTDRADGQHWQNALKQEIDVYKRLP